ncbi:MAG: 3-isopropylmalate dehydratase small subunit [Patescibacteria group bacterium]
MGGEGSKDFSGNVFYLPVDNVDTDQIIPAKYLTETNKEEFGKHCFEDAPISAENRPNLYRSQILVAGENFGCGSSREHAPWALESVGIKCVIAPSFARIFYENMFANGLLCIELPKDVIQHLCKIKPNRIEVNLENNEVSWQDNFTSLTLLKGSRQFVLSDYQKDLIKNGGSVGVMLKLAAELQAEGKI